MVIDAVTIIAVSLVLLSASVSDVRSREVDDRHWIVLLCLAVIRGVAVFESYVSIFLAAGIILVGLYMFEESVVGIKACAILAVSAIAFLAGFLLTGSVIPVIVLTMTSFLLALYHSGVIRGGADVKALIALTMVFPTYPEVCCCLWPPIYPEGFVFNPAFSVMFIALIISCMSPVIICCCNGGRGFALSSYEMPVEDARKAFVWPVQDFNQGAVVRRRISDENDEIYDRLEQNGIDHVRVTPMIPFILPITIGFIFTMVLGCPLFAVI